MTAALAGAKPWVNFSRITAPLIARPLAPLLIDFAAAKAHQVVVTHTPNVLNDDVADLALGLMLGLYIPPYLDAWYRQAAAMLG